MNTTHLPIGESRHLPKILAFVREHGFKAVILDGAVVFGVPFVHVGTHVSGFEAVSVKTMAGARKALGY